MNNKSNINNTISSIIISQNELLNCIKMFCVVESCLPGEYSNFTGSGGQYHLLLAARNECVTSVYVFLYIVRELF